MVENSHISHFDKWCHRWHGILWCSLNFLNNLFTFPILMKMLMCIIKTNENFETIIFRATDGTNFCVMSGSKFHISHFHKILSRLAWNIMFQVWWYTFTFSCHIKPQNVEFRTTGGMKLRKSNSYIILATSTDWLSLAVFEDLINPSQTNANSNQ